MVYAHCWRRRRAARRLETAINSLGVAAMLGMAVLLAVAGYRLTRPAECRVEVLAYGRLWIAGAGDTVGDAWRNAVIPQDWSELNVVCD